MSKKHENKCKRLPKWCRGGRRAMAPLGEVTTPQQQQHHNNRTRSSVGLGPWSDGCGRLEGCMNSIPKNAKPIAAPKTPQPPYQPLGWSYRYIYKHIFRVFRIFCILIYFYIFYIFCISCLFIEGGLRPVTAAPPFWGLAKMSTSRPNISKNGIKIDHKRDQSGPGGWEGATEN